MIHHFRTIFISACILMLLSLCSGCKKESLPTGIIYGNIYFTGTTIPVSEVVVEVNGMKDTSSVIGFYRINNIVQGEHLLQTNRKAFGAFESKVTISSVSAELNIQLSSDIFTSSIQGQISGNQTKNPIPDLILIILNPNGTKSELQAVSNDSGEYYIDSVPQGERTIILMKGSNEISRATINLQNWFYIQDFIYPEQDVPLEFTDSRDDNSYQAMQIGNQTWMTENLRYLPKVHSPREESMTAPMYYVYMYYGNNVTEAKNSIYYKKFGVAYNWTAAMKACPSGWHLPSDDEWNELQIYLGMNPSEKEIFGFQNSGNIGHKLKSKEGWENCWNGQDNNSENGDNSSHMNIIPSGGKGYFRDFYLPDVAVLWSSTEFDSERVWKRSLHAKGSIYRWHKEKYTGNFIRCVKSK